MARAPDKPKTLSPTRANVGIEQRYQRELERLVADMNASVTYWVLRKYGARPPELAQDASPAMTMRNLMNALARRWQRNFDRLAQELAEHFAAEVQDRHDRSMQAAMKRAGWTVKFRPTRAMNDAFQAVVGENVGLIKSLPERHLQEVQGLVMRSVAGGRDQGQLATDLEKRFDVTKRRAALIARDQNFKANAIMTRVRQQELGITEAIWMHSRGGKEPRPTHVAQSGNRYPVATGWLDPSVGQYIRPGELLNCRCYSKSVIPGFNAKAV